MDAGLTAIVLGQLALIGLFAWIIAGRAQHRARLRAELQGRMLERFASASEFEQFLNSERGRQFLESLAGPRGTPTVRILHAVQAGIVLCAFGIGVWIAGSAFGSRTNPVLVPVGEIVLALGVGFLLAAGVSYRISRAWGLVPKTRSTPSGQPASTV